MSHLNLTRFIQNQTLGIAMATAMTLPLGAQAARNSEVSHTASMIPLASVLIAGSVIHDVAKSSDKASTDLAAGSAALVVKSVQATAQGSTYVLERVTDGVRFTVNVSGTVANAASTAVGTAVTVSVVGAGVLLSAAGEVLAFIPNAIGQSLMHHERVAQ
jgi:hypothetical protein